MKKQSSSLKLAVLFTFLTSNAWAGFADDRDLGGPPTLTAQQIELRKRNATLMPDETVVLNEIPPHQIQLRFVYQRNQNWLPIEGLKFKSPSLTQLLSTNADGQLNLEFSKVCSKPIGMDAELKDQRFDITNGDNTYTLRLSLGCGKSYELRFLEASENGQAISIFETFQRAKNKLNASIGLGFWQNPITAIWPADGDYYNYASVHITNGHHWDVVGHELGHAIYDQGNLGAFGGGPHKIDECYSSALALSEGWASYFAAWLHIDLDNPDAKFPYMVPRRSPIHMETVPTDVCAGPTNEWRVSSFFWDLVDLNSDNESTDHAFSELWAAMTNSGARSVDQAVQLFLRNKMDAEKIRQTWQHNFLQDLTF